MFECYCDMSLCTVVMISTNLAPLIPSPLISKPHVMFSIVYLQLFYFFFQAEDGIRDHCVTGVQTCALPISTTVTGFVFDDINHNNIKDKNETGIKGVAVSDQVNVVTTGEDGSYSLPDAKGYGIVFVSVPDGYKSNDAFWQLMDTVKPGSTINFPLSKTKAASSFTFIHASDTHISPAIVDRMKKLEHITDSVKPDMMLITGDLVKDALRVAEQTARSLHELVKAERSNINTTV